MRDARRALDQSLGTHELADRRDLVDAALIPHVATTRWILSADRTYARRCARADVLRRAIICAQSSPNHAQVVRTTGVATRTIVARARTTLVTTAARCASGPTIGARPIVTNARTTFVRSGLRARRSIRRALTRSTAIQAATLGVRHTRIIVFLASKSGAVFVRWVADEPTATIPILGTRKPVAITPGCAANSVPFVARVLATIGVRKTQRTSLETARFTTRTIAAFARAAFRINRTRPATNNALIGANVTYADIAATGTIACARSTELATRNSTNATHAIAVAAIGIRTARRTALSTNGSDASLAFAARTRARTTIGVTIASRIFYRATRLPNTRHKARGKPTTLRARSAIFTKRPAKQGLVETIAHMLAVVEAIHESIQKIATFLTIRRLDLPSYVPSTSLKCFGSVTSIIKRTNLLGSGFVRIELEHT